MTDRIYRRTHCDDCQRHRMCAVVATPCGDDVSHWCELCLQRLLDDLLAYEAKLLRSRRCESAGPRCNSHYRCLRCERDVGHPGRHEAVDDHMDNTVFRWMDADQDREAHEG